ncbi:FAD-dependent oxidoreductase [Candidatus Poribacteria bacterium]|nr:FAD-dependent oxidoreductase [Candidatus Poribacteria bacterium]
MDIMGSPFLLAHGLGNPVEDAVTKVSFPEAGKYRLWVHTRDWVAPWKAPGTPGKFQVLIDDKSVDTIFGTEGSEWHWQDGGVVDIPDKEVKISLRDMTGFEGRCDAILFCSDADFTPPDSGEELKTFRIKSLDLPEKPEDVGEFDLVVIGAGIAGICSAISAARLGLNVALVQDRPVVGGNNSSEVRVWLGGERNCEPYSRVGDIVAQLEQAQKAHYGPDNVGEIYEDEKKMGLLEEAGVKIFTDYRVNQAEVNSDHINAVVAQNVLNARRIRCKGKLFADCTGDAAVGFLAGADYEITLKGHMGRCNNWNVKDTGEPVEFPLCPWAYDLSNKPFPGRSKASNGFERQAIKELGGWYWESGFDHDPIKDGEYIRDNNFRAMYGAWDALKNVDKVYPTYKLNWCAYVSGMRESRRLLGDVILTKDHLMNSHVFPDGCLPTGWDIDLHVPHKEYKHGFMGNEFISEAIFTKYPRPYWVPYRTLYSRNIDNLFMAGRNVSVTHEALGAVRVMRTGGLMGEIVGMAAYLCKEHDKNPRGIYEDHLSDLKNIMKEGVGKRR